MLRLLMKIPRLTRTAMVIILCFVASPVLAEGQSNPELKMNDISGVLKEAQEKAKELNIPDNSQGDDCGCRDAAGKVMERFNSPDFQAGMQDEQQRLRETVFKDILTESLLPDDKDSQAIAQPGAESLYLFVSSSVPLVTLRSYAAMIDRARAGQVIMVLRGFVDGMEKIRPTMEFIGEVLKKDPACDFTREKCDSYQVNIEIDPLLFQRFGIEEVPALAFQPISQGDAKGTTTEPIIINGDAGLDSLLERINRDAHSEKLTRLIAASRGGMHHEE